MSASLPALKLAIIDNFDSFTLNLAHLLQPTTSEKIKVVKNTLPIGELEDLIHHCDGLVLSPGPGEPTKEEDFGICRIVVSDKPESFGLSAAAAKRLLAMPVLGVCLGLQGLGAAHQARIVKARQPMHGMIDTIQLMQESKCCGSSGRCPLFACVPDDEFEAIRYNSLIVDSASLSAARDSPLVVTARSKSDAAIMALCHATRPIHTVQFHPESVASTFGAEIALGFAKIVAQQANNRKQCNGRSVTPHSAHQAQTRNPNHARGVAPQPTLSNHFATTRKLSDQSASHLQAKQNARSHIQTNGAGAHNPSSIEPTVYSLHCRQLPFVDSQLVFDQLFASSPHNLVWLDSAMAEAPHHSQHNVLNPSHQNGTSPSVSTAPSIKSSPSNASAGRFSYMCDSSGPFSRTIDYSLQTRIVTTSCTRTHTVQQEMLDASDTFLEYIKRTLVSSSSSLEETICDSSLDSRDSCSASSSSLPFDFQCGLAGYFSYEMRHETMPTDATDERTKRTQNEQKQQQQQKQRQKQQQNGHPSESRSTRDATCNDDSIPDGQLIFVDRCIVFDAREARCYAIALTRNESKSTSIQKMNGQQVEWLASIQNSFSEFSRVRPLASAAQSASEAAFASSTESRCDSPPDSPASPICWNFRQSDDAYCHSIAACQSALLAGESYELCLTNRLTCEPREFDAIQFYRRLRQANAAPYSALMRFDLTHAIKPQPNSHQTTQENLAFKSLAPANSREHSLASSPCATSSLRRHLTICCSSPERFLHCDSFGVIESKPIKGTMRRDRSDPIKDDQLKQQLRSSTKDFSENLMIVDLIRNDLTPFCMPGSVKVTKLMDIESYATVHQMVSTVQGQLASPVLSHAGVSCFSGSFPPGSMTGAPKLRSCRLLNELERKEARGPYSGCLGYFSLNGCQSMNVIIRTACCTQTTSVESPNASSSQAPDRESISSFQQPDCAPFKLSCDSFLCPSLGLGPGSHSLSNLVWIGAGGAIVHASRIQEELQEMKLKSKVLRRTINQEITRLNQLQAACNHKH